MFFMWLAKYRDTNKMIIALLLMGNINLQNRIVPFIFRIYYICVRYYIMTTKR